VDEMALGEKAQARQQTMTSYEEEERVEISILELIKYSKSQMFFLFQLGLSRAALLMEYWSLYG
jgi:hypothetical protein